MPHLHERLAHKPRLLLNDGRWRAITIVVVIYPRQNSLKGHNGIARMFHKFSNIGVPTLIAISQHLSNYREIPKYLYLAQS
jgi:hypothetical protein